MTEVKKGTASWQPAKRLNVANRDPNFRYRWINKDPANIEKRLEEGWSFVDTNKDAKHDRAKTIDDGVGIGTAQRSYRDLVLMKMPEQVAKARERYYADETAKQVSAVRDANSLKSRLNQGGTGTYGAGVNISKETVEIN